MTIPLINNNTDITLDVVFSRFNGFSITITLRQRPSVVPRRQHCGGGMTSHLNPIKAGGLNL